MKNKKNILLVSQNFSLTGAPLVLYWLATFLKSEGHNVTVWGIKDGPLSQNLVEDGFDVEIVDSERRFIKNKFERSSHNFDLIVCNTIVTYKFVDVLQRYEIPLVWYIHETKFLEDFVHDYQDCKVLLENFYNIYTVSEYAKSVIAKYNPNIKIIPNGVKDTFTHYSENSQILRFGFIGSIIQIKGIDLLVDSFIKLLENNKNISLTIAGQSDSELGLKLRNKTENIKEIKWLGQVKGEAKDEFFENIDVLCVPSIDDPCPLSVLEGAMKGKVIITTTNVGSNYILKDLSLLIVNSGDLDAIHSIMNYLCLNRDKIQELQKQIRNNYLDLGTIERQEQAIRTLIQDNLCNYPVVRNMLSLERISVFKKRKLLNKKREVYILGKMIFSYRKR